MDKIYKIALITKWKAFVLFWASFALYIVSIGEGNYLSAVGYVLSTYAFFQIMMTPNA